MTNLSTSELIIYIHNNDVSVISVCNNMYGNKLESIYCNNTNKQSLDVGNSVIIKRVNIGELHLTCKCNTLPKSTSKNINHSSIYGFEVCYCNNILCMPFFNDGATSFLVTVKNGLVWVDAGAITQDKVLLDYYHSEMNIGDEVCITIKKLDFISPPIRERYFRGCSL